MEPVAERLHLIDLHHRDAPNVIAAGVLELEAGLAVVDPGPTSTLARLEHGLEAAGATLGDVQALLLTHVHLDHAGAAGTIVQRCPGVRVYAHARGVRHLAAPDRLMASATRIFGEEMETLWGAMVAVPTDALVSLEGGEHLVLGGRCLDVAYTPGHASHHVSYLDTETGTAFAGDAAGGRIREAPAVVAATPPPDIDPALMEASWHTIRAWDPTRLFVTHFGPVRDVDEHGARYLDTLHRWADRVRQSLDDGGDDAAAARAFATWVGAELRASLDDAQVRAYEFGLPPWMSWYGLARYWRNAAE